MSLVFLQDKIHSVCIKWKNIDLELEVLVLVLVVHVCPADENPVNSLKPLHLSYPLFVCVCCPVSTAVCLSLSLARSLVWLSASFQMFDFHPPGDSASCLSLSPVLMLYFSLSLCVCFLLLPVWMLCLSLLCVCVVCDPGLHIGEEFAICDIRLYK